MSLLRSFQLLLGMPKFAINRQPLLPYSEARKKKYTSKQLEQLEYVPSALPRYPMLQSFDFTQDSMDILLRYEELFQKQSQCKREWREQR